MQNLAAALSQESSLLLPAQHWQLEFPLGPLIISTFADPSDAAHPHALGEESVTNK